MEILQYRDTEYYVTSSGDIWSTKSQKFLKHQNHKRGYLSVSLMINGKRATKMVHLMVAECWLPNPLNRPQVDHKDCNKHNPNSNNLEWVTKSENTKRAVANGLFNTVTSCGTDNGNHKRIMAVSDNECYEFDTVNDGAKFVGVSRTAISRCLTGRSKTSGGYKWQYMKV